MSIQYIFEHFNCWVLRRYDIVIFVQEIALSSDSSIFEIEESVCHLLCADLPLLISVKLAHNLILIKRTCLRIRQLDTSHYGASFVDWCCSTLPQNLVFFFYFVQVSQIISLLIFTVQIDACLVIFTVDLSEVFVLATSFFLIVIAFAAEVLLTYLCVALTATFNYGCLVSFKIAFEEPALLTSFVVTFTIMLL